MPERDFLSYEDWLYGGGLEGTGQQAPGMPGGSPMAAPQSPYNFRTDPNWSPTSSWQEDGQNFNLDPGSEWWWNPQFSNWNIRRKTAGPQQQTVPPPGGGGGGFGGGGGGGFGYLTEPFGGTPPAWQAGPSFNMPSFVTPPPFGFREFQAPTRESIYADPSYEFRTGEGRRALEQSAAGKGVLRTGGTLKDLINYGQNAASQEYSNIFDRSVQAHNLGLQQALGTYATNYGVSRDAYDRLFDANRVGFEGAQRENALMNQRQFDNFLADFDIFRDDRKRISDELWRAAGGGP